MKIAFLFLTIDDINFPDIWTDYFDSVDKSLYSIYCHPKYPDQVQTPWLKNNIIEHLTPTEWGRITPAYYNLLQTAYEDKLNIKFVTISESCIPLRSFNKLYTKIMKHPKRSYIKFMKISNYDMEARIKVMSYHEIYKTLNFYKHYARFCLSAYHVEILLKQITGFDFFNQMLIGDEFFLSLLYPFKHVKDFAITYDNWTDTKYKYKIYTKKIKKLEADKDFKTASELKKIRDKFNNNPKSYNIVSLKSYEELHDKKIDSFFWRKFPTNSNIRKFYHMI